MRISFEEFYSKHIDLSVPDMKKAGELFASGKHTEADKVFADYAKKALEIT